ncbi:type II toxin-antitoxin system RelE/ParE family toxin [uncultured Parabacteroides sp.]|nr:type II toxin-antitoxin system RelE/ParE family toxin [uncultured Parabacteroides sp.]
MEARPTQKQVITSSLFWESYDNVYVQGLDLFGFYQAELYANKIKSILYELDQTYPYYPECRHLTTKSRMYRNIILDSHLIIYRITEERIHPRFTPYHLPHHRGTHRGAGHRPFSIQHAKDQED